MVVSESKVSTSLESAGDLEDVAYSLDRTRMLTIGTQGRVGIWEKSVDTNWLPSTSWLMGSDPAKVRLYNLIATWNFDVFD